MNILHLLSQNQLTGAEVYAATLANHQLDKGHRVYQLSNDFFFPSRSTRLRLEVETKSRLVFFKNVLWLRNFIRKEKIQVLHSHSRAAAKLAYWALLFSKTAQVSTVHGVQHVSISKKLHNQYGEFIIAVCDHVKKHLVRDYRYSNRRIRVVANPINLENFQFTDLKPAPVKKIAIVGRTTGPKRERTEQILKELHPARFDVTLIGGCASDLTLDPIWNSKLKESTVLGLNSRVYSEYDLVIGSGRVCMEALITGVPTIAFGEAIYVGRITVKNFHEALESNFGDIHPDSKTPVIDRRQFEIDLNFSGLEAAALSKMAQLEFGLESISEKIQQIYESAYFLKNYSSWIPVLMYHKIPDTEIKSAHKIFVTKENFEQHLRFFKRRGFETLTFSDLKEFRSGRRSFAQFPRRPLILTFDDGYRDNLENAAPLLKKYNFRAQLFLLADKTIDRNQWDLGSSEPVHEIVSQNERLKWKDTPFEIGSHGFSHQKITDLDSAAVLNELVESKSALEKEFQQPVNVYAFTYGITTPAAAALAQRAGYDYAVNTDTGGILIEEEPFAVFRVSIFPGENRWTLLKKTSSWYRKYYHFKRKK